MQIRELGKKIFFNGVAPVLNFFLQYRQRVDRPVLILGNRRSGTTWVGNTLSYAPHILYYNEPNFVSGEHTTDFYTRGYTGLDRLWNPVFQGLLMHTVVWFKQAHKVGDRLFNHYRILAKENDYIYCAEWIAQQYSCQVVIVVRHPCAIAASYVPLGWTEYPKTMLQNQALVEDHLAPFTPHIEQAETHWERMGAALGARYLILAKMLAKNPEWILVAYEDFCLDPLEKFQTLYKQLGYTWTPEVQATIVTATSTEPSANERMNTWETNRVTSQQIDKWRRKVSPEQIEQVRKFFKPFASPWYTSPDEW